MSSQLAFLCFGCVWGCLPLGKEREGNIFKKRQSSDCKKITIGMKIQGYDLDLTCLNVNDGFPFSVIWILCFCSFVLFC